MKAIRRWVVSISSSFDWLINQVENHEALVNAAIQDANRSAGRAKAQLNRVRSDGQELRKRLAETQNSLEQWQERALQSARQNETKALECLKRRNRLKARIQELEVQEREHTQVEKQLATDLVQLEERILKLKHQRNIMRTRESRAEALNTLHGNDSALLTEIDDIFERWETRLVQYENQSEGTVKVIDEFEEEFVTREEEETLRRELTELKTSNPDL